MKGEKSEEEISICVISDNHGVIPGCLRQQFKLVKSVFQQSAGKQPAGEQPAGEQPGGQY